MRELRYAENSQNVSQQTGSSGRLRRKTGRACRTRNFAASQSKNRLPHLGESEGAFRKIVYQSRRSKSRVKGCRGCSVRSFAGLFRTPNSSDPRRVWGLFWGPRVSLFQIALSFQSFN